MAAGAGGTAPASDDIIVTAQKRVENAQDVPISIATFSSQALIRSNVDEITGLRRIATNLSFSRPGQASNVRISIRGIGSSTNTATEPSVATFVDGIYVPRPGALITNFLDIAGVEVLRGPQGTLFGRNASAGALSLRTAQPTDDLSGRITGEIGNSDRYRIDGFVNVPLSDQVAVRFAGLAQWFGGHWYNRFDGKRFGQADSAAGRATVKAEFGAATWLVRADYSQIKGDGGYNPDFLADSVSSAQLASLRTRLGGQLPDTNVNDTFANHSVAGDLDDRQWGLSSDLSMAIGSFTLRLINSYRNWEQRQIDGDLTFMPARLVERFGAYESRSQNHELQLLSPTNELLGGRLDFVAGLYYFQEHYAIIERLSLGSQYCGILVPLAQRPACEAAQVNPGGANATDLTFTQDLKSFAAYSQANFELTDTLELTGGIRWTKEEKEGLFDQKRANPFAATLRAPEMVALELEDQRVTWRVNLSWRPADDVMLFASYSTGFKSGGFNSGGGTPALGRDRRIFAREMVKNAELGARTSWADGALVANITFYRMDLNGYQDRAFDGISFIVRNAGNLRQQGFELDAVMRPVPVFALRASLAYLDSQFTDYKGAAGLPGIGGTQDLTGRPVNFSPEFTGNLGADLSGRFGGFNLRWEISGNLSLTSEYFTGINDTNPQTIQDGFVELGLRATVFGNDDRWSLALFGNNLTNNSFCHSRFYQVLAGAFGLANGVFRGSQAVRCTRSDPRTFGAAATFRF